jgi:Na+-transporting NADH:ubiquinone oxidoreductase subunit C
MAELSPLALWRRFLAAPADSRGKTLAMAVLVSAAAALAVSTAAVVLGPRLDANRAAEAQARLDALVATLPGLDDLLAEAGADRLDEIVVDLTTGGLAEGFDPATFDPEAAARDPALTTELAPGADIAGLGARPNLARLYVVRSGGEVALVILPVSGQGYQGLIRGFLALEGDFNTVAGLTITEQSETPGLGAKIEDAAWQALWPGTRLADATGEVRLAVVRGGATTDYEVDGITGATRTGTGVQNMIRFWVGPDGFGPVLARLRQGGL